MQQPAEVSDVAEDTSVAKPPQPRQQDAVVRQIEDQLRRYLQTDVHLQSADDVKGNIRISFYSSEDLDRLLDLILRERRDIY